MMVTSSQQLASRGVLGTNGCKQQNCAKKCGLGSISSQVLRWDCSSSNTVAAAFTWDSEAEPSQKTVPGLDLHTFWNNKLHRLTLNLVIYMQHQITKYNVVITSISVLNLYVLYVFAMKKLCKKHLAFCDFISFSFFYNFYNLVL